MPASPLASSSRSTLGQLWLALACLCGLLLWGWLQMRELPLQHEFQPADLVTVQGWLQPIALSPRKAGTAVFDSPDINDLFFVDAERGWAVGDMGTILHTQDGGASWQVQASGTEENLSSVHFVSAERGWAVGYNGTILQSQDGGASWQAQASGTDEWLNSVHFVSAERGWAVGG